MMRLLFALFFAAFCLSGATVDGINIHWTSHGKGNKTVILIHGWTGDETIWASQIPALAEKYRVITIDLPGHGKSGSPADGKFSMDLFARSIDAVRAEAKVKRAVLAGHSMGTPVVRQYARLYPKQTVALVLVDGVVANASGATVYAGFAQRMTGPNGRQAHEQFIKVLFQSPMLTQPMKDAVLNTSMATSDATATGAMAAMADPAIWKEDVLTIPVLAICADKSRLANRELMQQIFPKMEYVEIPETDHFLMLEKPQEFNRLLLGFLAKQKY
jgi:pimeloyl-ACP methyl ester carboxylesterase